MLPQQVLLINSEARQQISQTREIPIEAINNMLMIATMRKDAILVFTADAGVLLKDNLEENDRINITADMYKRLYNFFHEKFLLKYQSISETIKHVVYEDEYILKTTTDCDIYLIISDLIKGNVYPRI